jgi:hypothetical protein
MPPEKARRNMRLYAERVMPLVNKEIPDAAEPLPAAVPFPEEAGSVSLRSARA